MKLLISICIILCLSSASLPSRFFIVDDYPVTNAMLEKQIRKGKKQSGQTFSSDKAWFANDTLKQTLIFELYTDYHRMVTYHFYSSAAPKEIITNMELHQRNGERASATQKLGDFKGLASQSQSINSSFFVSKKGTSLGMSKDKALAIYGKADRMVLNDGIEMLEWSFSGDMSKNAEEAGRSVAQNSFGHKVVMYFKKGRLTAQVLFNEIP